MTSRRDPQDDQRLTEAGERIANAALDQGLVGGNINGPDITFGSILEQIAHFVKDFPEEEKSSRRRRLMLVLEKKFIGLLETDRDYVIDVDRRNIIRSVSDKIAAWMEGVINEAETRMGNRGSQDIDENETAIKRVISDDERDENETDFKRVISVEASDENETAIKTVISAENTPETQQKKKSDVYRVQGDGSRYEVDNLASPERANRGTMTDVTEGLKVWDGLKGPGIFAGQRPSRDTRNWAVWMTSVMHMAEDWGTWINQTVAAAEMKAAKKRGEVMTAEGQVDRLTRTEWNCWRHDVTREAINFTRVSRDIQKAAAQWRKLYATNINRARLSNAGNYNDT